jgi:hypothetical protein
VGIEGSPFEHAPDWHCSSLQNNNMDAVAASKNVGRQRLGASPSCLGVRRAEGGPKAKRPRRVSRMSGPSGRGARGPRTIPARPAIIGSRIGQVVYSRRRERGGDAGVAPAESTQNPAPATHPCVDSDSVTYRRNRLVTNDESVSFNTVRNRRNRSRPVRPRVRWSRACGLWCEVQVEKTMSTTNVI